MTVNVSSAAANASGANTTAANTSNALDAHRWRSPLLGECRTVELDAGPIEYFERGDGPVLVLAHGWLANANLWRNVVEELAGDFRCITLDLPLGSHRVAMNAGADLGPKGCGKLISDAIAALGLDEVTLVGNDSGGAYSQIATASQPDRIVRLVLNSCETPFDEFPPPPFDGLPAIAEDPATLGRLFEALRDREVRSTPAAYGLLIKHAIDELVSDSYALPCLADGDILRDTAKAMASATSAPVHDAGGHLIAAFERPVLLAWGPEDRVFPLAHAERYANELTDGRVELIPDAFSFTPEDQPRLLADALAHFCI
ncbi:MAG TPA: alpha/beta hydrolase [Solirubrobacteraceae bacterium]|jgi:pimeloyl-ACP methyl ester carboxylesterase|nr:alpha/beta hydrolase [Solirubrobacteraceae bacterium]